VGRVFAERYHALQLKTPRAVRNALIWRKHGLIDPLEVPFGAEVWMCLPLGVPR
jgi:hypothetical protein